MLLPGVVVVVRKNNFKLNFQGWVYVTAGIEEISMSRMRLLLIAATSLIFLQAGRLSFAEDTDTCIANCEREHERCDGKINVPNDLDAQDLRAVCGEAAATCEQKCRNPEEPTTEQNEQQEDKNK